MSSSSWSQQESLSGIFEPGPSNPYSGANFVYIFYCSSDAWIGDVGASAATGGFAFRGQKIIAATIADLVATKGLTSAADVVFGGCSAGARGATVMLDYVGAMLPQGARLRGLLDSGLWVDVEAPDTDAVTLQEQTQQAYAMIQPQAVIPSECAAQYSGAEAWKCIYASYRLPFVKTKYIINAAQFDSFAMLYGLHPPCPDRQWKLSRRACEGGA